MGMDSEVQYQKLVRLYRNLRTARMNVLYHERLLVRARRLEVASDLIVGIASLGAVSALLAGEPSWAWVSAIAAVIGFARLPLRLSDRQAFLTSQYEAYLREFGELREVAELARERQALTTELDSRLDASAHRLAEIESHDAPGCRQRLLEECYERVNREMPPETLWVPQAA